MLAALYNLMRRLVDYLINLFVACLRGKLPLFRTDHSPDISEEYTVSSSRYLECLALRLDRDGRVEPVLAIRVALVDPLLVLSASLRHMPVYHYLYECNGDAGIITPDRTVNIVKCHDESRHSHVLYKSRWERWWRWWYCKRLDCEAITMMKIAVDCQTFHLDLRSYRSMSKIRL